MALWKHWGLKQGSNMTRFAFLHKAFRLRIDMGLKGAKSEGFRRFLPSSGLQDKWPELESGNGAGEK